MNISLTIGQASKEVGLPTKTIRYYEQAGIFKPLKRQDNQYRIFTKEDIRRLKLIKETRALGIPLKEVKKIVDTCLEKGCKHARDYIEIQLPQYILSIDKKIAELEGLKQQLTFIRDHFNEVQLSNTTISHKRTNPNR